MAKIRGFTQEDLDERFGGDLARTAEALELTSIYAYRPPRSPDTLVYTGVREGEDEGPLVRDEHGFGIRLVWPASQDAAA